MRQSVMNVLLAGALTPCIRAYEHLLAWGVRAESIGVLTHDIPDNEFAIEFFRHRGANLQMTAPESRKTLNWATSLQPDLLLSFYYRKRIPKELLDLPSIAAVNLHPSLLPKYRGGFSAPWAIINGEAVTGVTYHYMIEEFDAGAIVLQQELPIASNDTALSLYHKQIILGLCLFDEMYDRVVDRRIKGKMQTGESSFFSRSLPNGGYIDLAWDRERKDRFIRAMYFPPHKGALLRLDDGNEVEILSLEQLDQIIG